MKYGSSPLNTKGENVRALEGLGVGEDLFFHLGREVYSYFSLSLSHFSIPSC